MVCRTRCTGDPATLALGRHTGARACLRMPAQRLAAPPVWQLPCAALRDAVPSLAGERAARRCARHRLLLHTCLGKSLCVPRANCEPYKAWQHFAAIVGSRLWRSVRALASRGLHSPSPLPSGATVSAQGFGRPVPLPPDTALPKGEGIKMEQTSHDASTLGAISDLYTGA